MRAIRNHPSSLGNAVSLQLATTHSSLHNPVLQVQGSGPSHSLPVDVQGPRLPLHTPRLDVRALLHHPLPPRCSRLLYLLQPCVHTSVAPRHTFADRPGAVPCPVLGAAEHRHPVCFHHVARDALVGDSSVVSEVTAQPEAIGWNPRVAAVYD